ncbi:MAG: hypothetical protein EXS50_00950 [Candidatus Taylorbacteria bacterium]|nr:hypothetical protein [Candidatus Taylorbacteria bacterium]
MQTLQEKWQVDIDKIVPATATIPTQRPFDLDDARLGTLTESMKKTYIWIEGLRLEIEALTTKLAFLKDSYAQKGEILSYVIPADKVDNYLVGHMFLTSVFQDSAYVYSTNRARFLMMLREQYQTPDDKPVLGIREGLVVICRAHDDRGDGLDAIDKWNKLTQSSKLADFQYMIRATAFLFAPVRLDPFLENLSTSESATPTDPPAEAIEGC